VQTGITGLTVHCRTTPMRPRERAIRTQLRMVADICRAAGVACVMNGDVTSRTEALALMREFNADGAMIATAAEKNPSCFRSDEEGGPHEWRSAWKTVVREYMRFALQVENRWGNTKYLLGQMIPGRDKVYQAMNKARCYADVVVALEMEDMLDEARIVDAHLGIPQGESKGDKKARIREAQRPGEKKSEKRKERDEVESEAKRVKGDVELALEPEVINMPQAEVAGPAALSV
jgi:tRNA-dihydrouridine synthase 2